MRKYRVGDGSSHQDHRHHRTRVGFRGDAQGHDRGRHGRGPHRPGPRVARQALERFRRIRRVAGLARPRGRHPRRPARPQGPRRHYRPTTGLLVDEGDRHPLVPGDRAEHRARWSRSTTRACSPTSTRRPLGVRRRRGRGRGRSAAPATRLEARVIHGGVLHGRPGRAHPVGPAAHLHAHPRRPRHARRVRRGGRRHGGRLVRALGPRRPPGRRRAPSARPAGRRQDRDPRRGRQPRRHHRGVGRGHGRPRRPRHRDARSRSCPTSRSGSSSAASPLGRPAITATQMLESMVHAPTPDPGRGVRRRQRRVRRLHRR